MPLASAGGTATTTYLKAGGKNCIGVQLATGTTPHIVFTKDGTNGSGGVCKQVVESAPVKVYLESTIPNASGDAAGAGKMAIGSSTSVYTTPTQ